MDTYGLANKSLVDWPTPKKTLAACGVTYHAST